MKRLLIATLLFAPFLIFPALASAQSTIPTLDQFAATTSPVSGITQRTYGKALIFTGITTGSCLTLDSNHQLTTIACGGSSFPFTPFVGYNATTTTLSFLNGFFSNASSTIGSTLHLTSLSAGGLAVDGNGLVYSGATSTLSTISGTLALSKLATQPANTFLANITGATAAPTAVATSSLFSATSATTLPYASSTASTVSGTASTTNQIISNSLTIGSLSGFLKATAGAVATAAINLASDVTGILGVSNGGTGWNALQANTVLLGNGSGAVATTSAGTNGQVLALVNGVPTWQATTTLTTITGTLPVSNGGTNATTFPSSMIVTSDNAGTTLVASSTPTARRYIATSSVASVFPFASTTAISVSQSENIGTTSPAIPYGLVASSTIAVPEYTPATSTSQTVDWGASNSQRIKIGTASVTISFTNQKPGMKLTLEVDNPDSGTAGTITWPSTVRWVGGTAPTQTTTAGHADLFSFMDTMGTSTEVQFGAQSANF